MKLPTEVRARLIGMLSGVFGGAALVCDGTRIMLGVMRDRQKLVIACYIEGVIEGKKLLEPGDIEKKFWYHTQRYVMSKKVREHSAKALRSRYIKHMPDIKEWHQKCVDERIDLWSPYFPSPRTVVTHLERVCQTIEIVDSLLP